MIPYAVKCGRVPMGIYREFLTMCRYTQMFPDPPEGDLTCHAVCKALAMRFESFRCVDGHFDGIFQHSWLVPSKHQNIVVDMYPVAGVGSFMLDTDHFGDRWAERYVSERKPNFCKKQVREHIDFLLAKWPE